MLVPAKCTQCGADVEVDNNNECAICSHCGTPFIVEKAINNYNIGTAVLNIPDDPRILAKIGQQLERARREEVARQERIELCHTRLQEIKDEIYNVTYADGLTGAKISIWTAIISIFPSVSYFDYVLGFLISCGVFFGMLCLTIWFSNLRHKSYFGSLNDEKQKIEEYLEAEAARDAE